MERGLQMNNAELIARAESFLNKNKISYVKPGTVGEKNNTEVEVIFLVPEALDPNVVIDPPDVRVKVNVYTGEVTLIIQM